MKKHMRKYLKLHPVISFYWKEAKKYPRALAGVIFVVPLTILINGYLPTLILADVLSKLSQNDFVPGDIWQSFGPQLVAYGVLLFTGIGAWRIIDLFTWHLEQNISRDMANKVFRQMLRESADFHANSFAGSLVSQTNKLLGGYIRLQDTIVYQTYPMICGIIIVSIILAFRAPLFSVALLVFASLFIVLAIAVSKPVRKKSAIAAAAESRQTGFLADAVSNVMAIKSFARTKFEQDKFYDVTTDTQTAMKAFAKRHNMQMNVLGIISRSISVMALIIAVISVMKFRADIGTVFLIFSYTANIVDQLFQFGNSALRNYSRSTGDASEMVATLAQTPVILDPESPEPVRIDKGAITFDAVEFTHNGADDAIFHKLQLQIKPGEKIGLVGHSGSGKSTFVRLLLRFSDIDSGKILIDGQNIARITQDDLHAHIAYVPQEPLLFHRTIAENIAYGQEGATAEAIKLAARQAHAAEFIETLPHGYETLVGERGVKLSGGQRQRVAIARAMLKNAPILVLDEATSALDSESEVLIQQALWKLMEGRTAIVIAHRLSTIQKMDRIIVLDNGRIAEEGSHKELIQKGGTYAKLWSHQSGGFIDD